MHVRDLLVDNTHHDKYLILRTFAHTLEVSSMQDAIAVEDEKGEVEQLSIYHYDYSRWPDNKLCAGMVLAVKNPYLRSVIANGGMSLCAFHPSDVVVLDQDHELYPANWKTAQHDVARDAAQWKVYGNTALKEKNLQKANYSYGKGLSAPGLTEILKSDLHRNKAYVELFLGLYDATKTDALTSLLNQPDDKSKELDCKAFYRAGRALYELADYQEAKTMFDRCLQLSPQDKDGLRELKRTVLRITEERDGHFDFVAMSENITLTKDFRAKQASHVRRTEIKQTEDRGKGLFATQPIACGDIVLCEKAFVAEHPPWLKPQKMQNFIVSPSSKHVFWGGHAETWSAAVRKVFHNPSLASRLLDLCARSNYNSHLVRQQATPVNMVDDLPIIDVFHILDLLENNGLGFMARPDQTQAYPNIPRPQLGAHYDCLGIWPVASRANHSCLPNVEYSFLGDFMLVRANKDILKGEEIALSYVPPTGNFEQQKMALRNWNFKCECRLCCAETEWDGTRSNLLSAADSYEEAEPPIAVPNKHILDLDRRTEPAVRLINVVKLYIDQIQDTYPTALFSDLPTIGLAKRHAWLMRAYVMGGGKSYSSSPTTSRNTACMYAQAVIRDHGFKPIIEVPGEKVSYDRENVIMTTDLVDAFMFLSLFYEMKGNTVLAKCMKDLGMQSYITMNGSSVGYDVLYS
jgi:tetratricopeptide (TPR) repeat protein